MEDYTTWHSDRLYSMLRILRLSHAPEDAKWYALIAAELDRRCDQAFEWCGDQLYAKPENNFVTMEKSIFSNSGYSNNNEVVAYPISNPAEFSALLQYFISKPKL